MRVRDLAVLVRQDGRAGAVQHGWVSCAERRRLGRFHADESDVGIVQEAGEDPDRVRAAADARDDDLRQPAFGLAELLARLAADHGLQLALDLRVWSGADARADQIVRRLDVRDPVANRLARCLLERAGAEVDGPNLRAEQVHALDVGSLAPHVLLAHVDDALETEASTHCRGCDSMLSRAGLRHDAALAQTAREHSLTEGVVELVRAGVQQVLPLQIEAFARRKSLGAGERCRSAGKVAAELAELRLERLVGPRATPARLQLVERRNERLRDVTSAVCSVQSGRRRHRAASTNARTLS